MNPVHTGQIITTERTGKGLKAQQMFSVITIIVGVILIIVGANTQPKADGQISLGAILTAVGFVWYVVTRFKTWWRHG